MTAAPRRTTADRIADLFRDGYTLNYVAERGIVAGWTRADAEKVGEELGGLSKTGRFVPKLPAPVRLAPAPAARLQQAHRTRQAALNIPRNRQQPREVEFTPAQLAVLEQLLTDGADDQAIATRMGRTINTTKSHLKGMLKRSGMPNRCALAIAVLKGEIVPVVGNGRRI